MQKEDLKALVNQMHRELIENIDAHENPTKEQVVTFLQDATNAISSLKNNSVNDLERSKLMFTNAYRDIAKDSLASYSTTNNAFEELAQIHEETLLSTKDLHINLPDIAQKFEDLQKKMFSEIQRANSIITDLTTQINQLERNSNLDSLTKVFNRRALTTYLERLCEKGNIAYELHLLILDIDDFKVINDTFGHIAGDKVIMFIANILRSTLRDGDKVFRYGGEEFVIILNRLTPSVCLEVTNRILKLIRSNQLIYQGDTLNVTMSIGGTQYINGDTPEAIISRADKALYKSKKNGKDQMNSEVAPNGN
ncbi:GGDEF domain-containing protein [Sulfurimonas sp. SAG-AH-194-L11]|nr:GGDEF domain-containing protein [Sulfurimonas sp. SAG-AH-194-L11]MDF1877146.1 GGDEF domain-containing protein [Sulfurimonas sp. SAG-AH-194-L11]